MHRTIAAFAMGVLLVTSAAAQGAEARSPGFRGWRFGMTADEVKKVPDCGSYAPVAATGGLECATFAHEGRKMNISFVFGPKGLAKIQLWVYEGKEAAKAVDALDWTLALYRKSHGALESPTMPGVDKADRKALAAWVAENDRPAGPAPFKAQFAPRTQKPEAFTFASYIHQAEHGYYVFVYFQPPRS